MKQERQGRWRASSDGRQTEFRVRRSLLTKQVARLNSDSSEQRLENAPIRGINACVPNQREYVSEVPQDGLW